jgi:PAS domain S-box-containing protein
MTSPSSEALHLLVVDDDADASFTIKALVELAPGAPAIEVVQATEFEEALRQAESGTFDVLVFDVRLGARSGLDLLRECRARGLALPAIMLTGRGDEQTAVEAMKAGATDYLAKSRLTPELLVVALRHACERVEKERLARQVEDTQRASEEHLRLVGEMTNDTIWWLDLVSRVTRVSAAFETVFGYPQRVIEDETNWWSARVHPDDRARVLESFQRLLAGVESSWSEEYRFERADGSYAHVLDRAYLVRGPSGRPLRVVGTLMDMTGRVRREEELRQAQKMEAIGRLAGGVAHDFNNLLTAIIGYSELLVGQVPDGAQRRAVEQIRQAGQRAASLTQQLLAFSRKQMLLPEVLDLNQVVAGIKDMLRRLIGEDVEVTARLGDAVGRVRADRTQLEQVIVNLAVNARDAMPRGGRLCIETRALSGAPARALLAVSDTGCGMPPEVVARVFEPFFTTKEVGKGTGLGLSSVYGTVKQSGGEILVRSTPGEGTTFEIYLPVVDAPASASHLRPRPAPPGGRETVLLVEDEDAVRRLVREVLTERGYEVFAAARGEEALDLVARIDGPIHLVLTDLIMPGLSGRDLALRLDELRPGIRVIFMTGYSGDTLTRAALAPGTTVLEKPFTPDHLATVVRAALDAS